MEFFYKTHSGYDHELTNRQVITQAEPHLLNTGVCPLF